MTKRYLFIIIIFVLFLNFSSAALNVSLSDTGTNVKYNSNGSLLSSGNLQVTIYDTLTGGNLIYNETFVGAIVNGSWNVMLGENSSNPLSLEFGKIYYRDYMINGQDLNFTDFQGNSVGRRFFYSPLGDIQGNYISSIANLTVANITVQGNITASTGFFNLAWNYLTNLPNIIYGLLTGSDNINNLLISNGTAVGYNQTVLNNSIMDVGLSAGFNNTYNATYDAYKTNVSYNWTLLTNATFGNAWSSTYNATYEGHITFNLSSFKTNLTQTDCAEGTLVIGISDNGTVLCAADSGTGNYFNQQLNTTSSPQFVNLTLTGNLTLGIGKIIYNTSSNSYIYWNTTDWVPFGIGISTGGGNLSSDAYYRVYDTGWISRSDWTNVHLGSNTTKNVDSNVTHNLGAPLSNLTVKVLISTDGTDANSFEVQDFQVFYVSSVARYGAQITAIDNNNIKIQTGLDGLQIAQDDGTHLNVDTEDWYYKIKVTQIVRLNTSSIMGGVPAGAVMAFNSATCPVGWIAADGTSGTPDLRGLFIRGAGTSGVLKYANGSLGYISATFGEYQNDSFQGHRHVFNRNLAGNVGTGAQWAYISAGPGSGHVLNPESDGTYGTPRTGAETRPASYVLTYCMKTTEDTVTSNTLFQESGGIISTANSSHQVDVKIRSYNTSWVSCSDWTDQHLGTTLGGNVTHNLNAPLSDLLVRVLISTDGTDANSFETLYVAYSDVVSGTISWGVTFYQVDMNNVKVQTGIHGLMCSIDAGGNALTINTQNWYYKIKVWKLG